MRMIQISFANHEKKGGKWACKDWMRIPIEDKLWPEFIKIIKKKLVFKVILKN